MAALLARACEGLAETDRHWVISRLTIELTRPVPVGRPLAVTTSVERPGRKVSIVAASIWCDGLEVAKVRAQRIRRHDFDLPAHPLAPPEIEGTPGAGTLVRVGWALHGDSIAFHSHGSEHRIIEGGWDDPGPIKAWIRLAVPVIEGESPTGVQRVAAVADFGNGVSNALDHDGYVYINPDLTVHLAREPVGEWIGLSSHSVYGTPTSSSGVGFAESALHDASGRLGRSVQSLLVEAR